MNETDDKYNQLDSKSCQFINKNQEDEAVWFQNIIFLFGIFFSKTYSKQI